MTVRGHSRRGFTLIELLVTAVVAIIMLGAAMALFTQSITEQHEQRRMAEMKRSAALVLGQLTTELRQAGLGRPRAGRVGTSGGGNIFPGSILVAEPHRIAFIADLPRPDSTFNGFSQLAADQTASTLPANGLALLNELNGSCDVVKKPLHCTTDTASHLFDYPTANDANNCADHPGSVRTCPWSLNRYRADEYVIVADALGRWVERQVDDGVFAENTTSRRVTLQLNSSVPAELFASGPSQGYISTPDRVFFRRNGGWWERKQCWGTVGVGSPMLSLNTPCADGNDAVGTNWERLARVGGNPRPVDTFTYFKANSTTPLTQPISPADLRLITRVEIQLELQRPRYPSTGASTPIYHVARGSITLRQ